MQGGHKVISTISPSSLYAQPFKRKFKILLFDGMHSDCDSEIPKLSNGDTNSFPVQTDQRIEKP